jgi:hypothetical protein
VSRRDGLGVEEFRRLLRGEHRSHAARQKAVVFVGDEHPDLGDAAPLPEREGDHPREEQREGQHRDQTDRRAQLSLDVFRDEMRELGHQSRSSRPVRLRKRVLRLGG